MVKIEGQTKTEAELKLLSEAIGRIKRPVELHIWTNNGLMFGAFSNGWINTWSANGFKAQTGEEIKHAKAWMEVLEHLKGAGIALDAVTIHHREENSFNKYLNWEIKREV